TALAAGAAQVRLIGPATAALGPDLTADALEVGVGEAIPYTLTVRNPGSLTVTGIRIATQLPVGARYAPGSAVGADSSVVVGGQLILLNGAALPPGASRALRFVVGLVCAAGLSVLSLAPGGEVVSGGQDGSC